jgi:nucleoside-diphosphate-sugar epimerase
MKNILVLGSSGQIGGHLIEHHKSKGDGVIPFDVVNSEEQDLRIPNNSYLLECLAESDFVYFLAFDVGGSRYLQKYQNSYEFYNNNIELMSNTFKALRDSRKPFIFASSQMSNMDYSPYGKLKSIGEHYTNLLNGIIVKFWNVYGIENDLSKSHVITDFILKAKDGQIKMLTDGTEERQFLHADDCSRALDILGSNYENIDRNRELHITSHEWNTIMDIAVAVSEKMGGVDIVPGDKSDDVQLNKKNEPDSYILKYWAPKINLLEGIQGMCDYYDN